MTSRMLANAAHWSVRGNCADLGEWADVMYPEEERGEKQRKAIAAAKHMCAGCPVARQCLTDAMANEDWHGIRAGLTGDYRRKHWYVGVERLLLLGGVET